MKKVIAIILMLLIVQLARAQRRDDYSKERAMFYYEHYDKYMGRANVSTSLGTTLVIFGVAITAVGFIENNHIRYNGSFHYVSPYVPYEIGAGILLTSVGLALAVSGANHKYKIRTTMQINGITPPIIHKNVHNTNY